MDGLLGIVFSIIILLLFSTAAGIFAFATGSGFSAIAALGCICCVSAGELTIVVCFSLGAGAASLVIFFLPPTLLKEVDLN